VKDEPLGKRTRIVRNKRHQAMFYRRRSHLMVAAPEIGQRPPFPNNPNVQTSSAESDTEFKRPSAWYCQEIDRNQLRPDQPANNESACRPLKATDR
jgi:hypothetical protein